MRALADAYREYALSSEGAGSVQPRVVQRLIEAVFDTLPELERLQRIEAAARAAVDCTLVDDTCAEHNALRAALRQD